jgi:uncharacterized membrane protein YdbT with pleckstrin-like domain
MSYVDRTLLDGEQLVFRTRLHWLLYLKPFLIDLLVFLPLIWWLWIGSARRYAWIPVAVGLLAFLPAYVRRRSSDFAVTNKRVMMKEGILSTRSIELLHSKIEAIAVEQSLLGRVLGYGDITVTGSGGTRELFTHIQSPLQFRRAVQGVADRDQETTGATAAR